MMHSKTLLVSTAMAIFTLLAVLPPAEPTAREADAAEEGKGPAELLLFYSNDVRGELEPCG